MPQLSKREAVLELRELAHALNADVEHARALYRENDNQFTRRTVVRTFFALIEGLAYNMRQVTLASLGETTVLTPGEIALLREEKYSLSDKGLVRGPQESFLSTCPGFLFSIRTFAKCHGAAFEPDLSQGGWEAFRKLADFRNRIAHPKSSMRLNASNEDMKAFGAGASWATGTITAMFNACDAAFTTFEVKF